MKLVKQITLAIVLLQWNVGYSEAQQNKTEQKPELDISTIEQITGMKGTEQEGEYKLTVPQNDLDVTVDGFTIVPPMGMGSWAAFSPTGEGAILMGDIVVQEEEITAVQKMLNNSGLNVTALHIKSTNRPLGNPFSFMVDKQAALF